MLGHPVSMEVLSLMSLSVLNFSRSFSCLHLPLSAMLDETYAALVT